jgi:hydrogenase maturation protein HypF
LGDPASCVALEQSVQALLQIGHERGWSIQAVAHDLHPDFFSTQLAQKLARQLCVPAVGVQHHHAHIGAVMADQAIAQPVLGLALDGVGMGTDGTAWGGELLWVDPDADPQALAWERIGHLWPLALPGGDRAAREPWRMAAAALHSTGRRAEIVSRWAPQVGEPLAKGVQQMLSMGLNSPMTSSAGRWFDAAAAALGLCVRQGDDAQAAMALEAAASRWLAQHPAPKPKALTSMDSIRCLDMRPLWTRLLDTPPTQIDAAAAAFHLGLADALVAWVQAAACQTAYVSKQVCLGGGCFVNRILRERVTQGLQAAGFEAHQPKSQFGDAHLCLGQAWVVSQQLRCTDVPLHEKENLPCV